MNQLETKIYESALPICVQFGVELVSVELVQEHGVKILRFLIDKQGGVDIEDATLVNEALSALLDVMDPISTEYYLEVSSLGLERELKTKEEIGLAIGKYINIKTYEKIKIGSNSLKEFEGYLLTFDGEDITINAKIKQFNKEIVIPYSLVAKIRLAIKF